MRVLVLGSGAHEHALAAGFAAGQEATDIICAPVIVASRKIGRTAHADLSGPDRLLHLAARQHVDFTIVGPELPLTTRRESLASHRDGRGCMARRMPPDFPPADEPASSIVLRAPDDCCSVRARSSSE
jgi:hypothetical protein